MPKELKVLWVLILATPALKALKVILAILARREYKETKEHKVLKVLMAHLQDNYLKAQMVVFILLVMLELKVHKVMPLKELGLKVKLVP